MKRMNQTLAFLLAAMTAAGCVSCGDSQPDTKHNQNTQEITETGAQTESVDPAKVLDVPEMENRYNAKVVECLAPVTAFPDTLGTLQKSVMASEDLYDLAFLRVGEVGTAAHNNYL